MYRVGEQDGNDENCEREHGLPGVGGRSSAKNLSGRQRPQHTQCRSGSGVGFGEWRVVVKS